MNKYPAWKYVVIAVALVVAFLYTLPNFYGTVPALQVAGLRAVKADATTLKTVEDALNLPEGAVSIAAAARQRTQRKMGGLCGGIQSGGLRVRFGSALMVPQGFFRSPKEERTVVAEKIIVYRSV